MTVLPNTSVEPTAMSRCDQCRVGVLHHSRSFMSAAAGLWLTSIR